MSDYSGETIDISDSVKATLRDRIKFYADTILKSAPPSLSDSFNVFLGHGGRAFLFLKLWNRETDSALKARYLNHAKDYIDISLKTIKPGYTSFFQGPAGPYTLGAIIYDAIGDTKKSQELIASLLKEFQTSGSYDICTLDEGKAGLMWAGTFLNNYFKREVIPRNLIVAVGNATIELGRKFGFPNGTMQFPTPIYNFVVIGQGHGSGGVIRMLLDVPELVNSPYVKKTLDYFVSLQLPSGNFPTPDHKPYSDECTAAQGLDCLVQWCHGSPGFVGLMSKAYAVYKDTAPEDARRYYVSAERASDNMWQRGLLTKGLMFCHGIGGNAYLFLGHFRWTGQTRSLWRALQFVRYALDPVHISSDVMRVGDTPNSLFQGSNAVLALYADLLQPSWQTQSFMPGYDLEAL